MNKPLRLCVALVGALSATAVWSAALFTPAPGLPLVFNAVTVAQPATAFIDPALPDAQQLQAAARAQQGAQPGSLPRDASKPGTPGVFHLFSHGKPGQLLINGQWLGAPQIAAWLRQSLPEGTEHLNLYGCEFAQGEEGAQAVKTLEQLLGLSVAASDDVTGQGGDWDLEVGPPLAALRVEDYAHSLQCTGPSGDCDGDTALDTADLDSDNDGILDVTEQSCGFVDYLATNLVAGGPYTSSNLTTINGQTFTWETYDLDVPAADRHHISQISSLNIPPTGKNIVFYQRVIEVPSSTALRWDVRVIFPNGTRTFSLLGYDFDGPTYEAIRNFSVPPTSVSANVAINSGVYTSNSLDQDIILTWNLSTPINEITFRVTRPNNFLAIGFDMGFPYCDNDGDGIQDYLDTDSDADGCPDVIEGGANFVPGASYITSNRLNTPVNGSGVPGVPAGTSGYTQADGQTVGDSLVATQVLVNGTNPVNQTVTTIPSAASFTISTSATNTTVFSAGVPQYGSGSSADANTVYQWYLGDPDAAAPNTGTPITNGGVYSGATSATLGISNVQNLIGNTYYVVVTQTNRTCTRIVRSAQLLSSVVDLAITKTNTPGVNGEVDQANDTVTRGPSGTTYRIVVTNNGPGPVTGAVVRDTATGLTCTGLTCTSSPASPSSCPAVAPTAAQLLSPAGVTLQALPVGGTVSMDLTCTVN